MLVGPFDFAPKEHGVAKHQIVPSRVWDDLAAACHSQGLVSPTLSTDPIAASNTIVICEDTNLVPWYHSSVSFANAVEKCIPDL